MRIAAPDWIRIAPADCAGGRNLTDSIGSAPPGGDTPGAPIVIGSPPTCGAWIVTGVEGERWPVAARVFRATYRPVIDGRAVAW